MVKVSKKREQKDMKSSSKFEDFQSSSNPQSSPIPQPHKPDAQHSNDRKGGIGDGGIGNVRQNIS